MNGTKFMLNGHSLLLGVLLLMSAVVFLALAKYFFSGAGRLLRRRWDDLVSPKKALPACVKEKRLATFIKYHTYDHGIRSTGKRYFAAFAPEGQPEVELEVSAKAYEQLKEGDCGTLRFKGSRFLGFEQA